MLHQSSFNKTFYAITTAYINRTYYCANRDYNLANKTLFHFPTRSLCSRCCFLDANNRLSTCQPDTCASSNELYNSFSLRSITYNTLNDNKLAIICEMRNIIFALIVHIDYCNYIHFRHRIYYQISARNLHPIRYNKSLILRE